MVRHFVILLVQSTIVLYKECLHVHIFLLKLTESQIFAFLMCVQTSTHIMQNILTTGKCTHFVSFSKCNPLIYYFV
jgi:hypothetical protein